MTEHRRVGLAACVALSLGLSVAYGQGPSKRQPPPVGAVAFVIDKSGSMSGSKMRETRAAVKATIAWMPGPTWVAVVAFDTQATLVLPATRAGWHKRVASKVDGIKAGGGTDILPALKLAYRTLDVTGASRKHVVLISDGQSSYTGLEALAKRMRKSNITISTVAIGGADETLLKLISSAGGGRFFKVSELQHLHQVFRRDTMLALKQ